MENKKNSTPLPVHNILLSDIEIDPSWNLRSGDWQKPNGTEDDTGYQGLIESIEQDGLDDPVTLATKKPTGWTSPKGSEAKFFLMAGYRRYAAVTAIAKKKKTENPTIAATVREDLNDPVEARALNMRENTMRDGIKAPDLAVGILELHEVGKLSAPQIAKKIGRSQPYVNKLLKIQQKVKPNITKKWRESPIQIPIEQMYDLAAAAPEDQEASYRLMLKGKTENKPNFHPKAGQWLEALRRKAYDFGYVVGELTREKHLNGSKMLFADCIHLCVKIPHKATEKQIASLAEQAEEGYIDGFEGEPEEEAKEEKKPHGVGNPMPKKKKGDK